MTCSCTASTIPKILLLGTWSRAG